MKNIFEISYRLFSVLVLLTFLSCEDRLELSPETEKDATTFFSTENEIEAAVSGAYAVLQYESLYGLHIVALGEVPSDNAWEEVAGNDGGIFGQLDLFTQTSANGLLEGFWTNSYVAIQRCNVVLNRIEAIEFESDITKSARTGEMHFIRALMYFNLVQAFGDVPLVVEETEDPSSFFGQTRTPLSEVYAQIETDLEQAISLLPDEQTDAGRATNGAATALLGKVLLTQGDLDGAKTQFESVVSSGNYSLLTDLNSVFSLDNENNDEVIFSVQFASGQNEGSDAFVEYSPAGRDGVAGGKGHNLLEPSLYNAYEADDGRLGVYVDITTDGAPYTLKWKENTDDPEDGGSDVIVIRYADILLLLAEIEIEQSNLTAGMAYLNQVRNRAGLANTTETTQDGLRDAVYLERRLELANEGHRWFDLLRRGNAIETMNAFFVAEGRNLTMTSKDLLMPIPQAQIDADPNAIEQNPGY